MAVKSDVQPLISVYLTTKNRQQLLSRAIESVLAQDHQNCELIIVDDGSSDDTPLLVADYQQKNSNISYYRNEQSQGTAAARNLAISYTNGEFITGLDDDDHFLPNRLSSLLAAYDDKYAFVCSSVIWDFGHRQKVSDKKTAVFTLQEQLNYNHATTQILVKRERIQASGAFDTNLDARLDYDAWTCLMIRFGSALRINVPSYVLSRNEGVARITNSPANVTGNHQFMTKHRALMNEKNLKNQIFWDLYAQHKPLLIKELMPQLLAGNALMKFKYFIKINLMR
jgi:glycosyltransferase involved in cell wall biosynthesis